MTSLPHCWRWITLKAMFAGEVALIFAMIGFGIHDWATTGVMGPTLTVLTTAGFVMPLVSMLMCAALVPGAVKYQLAIDKRRSVTQESSR